MAGEVGQGDVANVKIDLINGLAASSDTVDEQARGERPTVIGMITAVLDFEVVGIE